MVKAIIFDVDGTLLDSEKLYMEAWRQAAAQKGFVMPESALRRTRAVKRSRVIEIFREELGPDFSYEETRPLRVEIVQRLFAEATDLLKPGVRETLAQLKAWGLPMGVASTTVTAETRKHLEQFGIADYFSVIVGGDQVENGKPAPDIFLRAASLLGAAPEDCLAVGDTPADVFSATDGGIPIIVVPDQVPPDEAVKKRALAVVETIDRMLPYVR